MIYASVCGVVATRSQENFRIRDPHMINSTRKRVSWINPYSIYRVIRVVAKDSTTGNSVVCQLLMIQSMCLLATCEENISSYPAIQRPLLRTVHSFKMDWETLRTRTWTCSTPRTLCRPTQFLNHITLSEALPSTWTRSMKVLFTNSSIRSRDSAVRYPSFPSTASLVFSQTTIWVIPGENPYGQSLYRIEKSFALPKGVSLSVSKSGPVSDVDVGKGCQCRRSLKMKFVIDP